MYLILFNHLFWAASFWAIINLRWEICPPVWCLRRVISRSRWGKWPSQLGSSSKLSWRSPYIQNTGCYTHNWKQRHNPVETSTTESNLLFLSPNILWLLISLRFHMSIGSIPVPVFSNPHWSNRPQANHHHSKYGHHSSFHQHIYIYVYI